MDHKQDFYKFLKGIEDNLAQVEKDLKEYVEISGREKYASFEEYREWAKQYPYIYSASQELVADIMADIAGEIGAQATAVVPSVLQRPEGMFDPEELKLLAFEMFKKEYEELTPEESAQLLEAVREKYAMATIKELIQKKAHFYGGIKKDKPEVVDMFGTKFEVAAEYPRSRDGRPTAITPGEEYPRDRDGRPTAIPVDKPAFKIGDYVQVVKKDPEYPIASSAWREYGKIDRIDVVKDGYDDITITLDNGNEIIAKGDMLAHAWTEFPDDYNPLAGL